MLNASFVRLGLTRTLIATMSSLLFFCLNANAQSTVVKPKAGAEGWEISYSRMFDPNNYELDTVCSTMAAAQQEVARLKVWNSKIDPKDSWRLHTILIVGAEANSASAGNGGIGPKISNFIDAAKLIADAKKIADNPVNALLDAAKPDAGLKEYAKMAGVAYDNAKKAKEELLKLTGKTVKDGFVRVNLLVDQYNKTADDLTKSSGFGAVPKMSKVSEKTLKAADDWRAARDKQFDLEGQKQRLDDDRQRLEAERQALYQAYQQAGDPIPAELIARIKRYREQQDAYNSSLAAFEAETKKHETNVTSIDKGFSRGTELSGTTWVDVDTKNIPKNILRREYEFRSDGRFIQTDFYKDGSSDDSSYLNKQSTWKQNGNSVTYVQQGPQDTLYPYRYEGTGTIGGDTLTLRIIATQGPLMNDPPSFWKLRYKP